jgi:His-Xaa-Ser system protein HxsD
MNRNKTPGKPRSTTYKLSPAVYSAEAVKLASFVFSERAKVKTRPVGRMLEVSVEAGDPCTASEFMNEVLNQQCRLDLAKKNSKIAGMIVTKALLSAAGKK